ncbi:MAG: 4Fe-4S dicluster domain-containing protein [Clostridiaceae bacterium]
MIRYEHELKRLKASILKEVVLLTKENILNKENINSIKFNIIPSEEPKYRSCVEHEREVVDNRARLAAGFAPNTSELKSIKEDGQVIHVIESACDKCPTHKFVVTDACRGCISHKCMEVCAVKSISRVNGKALIDQDTCKECGMCAKACPYSAISEVKRPCIKSCPTAAMTYGENEVAAIKEEKCIQCGACMSACPFGAVTDKSFISDVVKCLESDKNVYAIVAPAIVGQFGPKTTLGQIKQAMINAGFKDMIEASCGADAVTVHESNEFLERLEHGDKYMTNSCCPGMVGYVNTMFPSEKDKVSSTVSPMIATARKIKSSDKDAVCIFVGPCTAKKSEASIAQLRGSIEYVLTFEEIAALLEAYNVDPEVCEEVKIEDGSLFGRNFAIDGGLTAAIINYVTDKGVSVDFKPVVASGGDEIKKAMTMARVGRLDGNFIEGMMCLGGCVGGPATILPQNKVRPILNKFSKESKIKTVLSNDVLPEFETVEFDVHK